jgi:hypothetical protein
MNTKPSVKLHDSGLKCERMASGMKIRKASSRSSVTSLDRENIILVLCNNILSHFIELRISLYRPIEVQVEAPEFLDNRHMKVVRLSALRTGCLYPSGKMPGTHFCYRLSRLQCPIAARRIKSVTPSEIEPATCRRAARCLNQLSHRVPYHLLQPT